MDDMEERYKRVGSTLRGVHLLRRNVALRMGDRPAGAAAHHKWLHSMRDRLSDGLANEQDFLVEYLVFVGQYEEAITQAAPLLTGRFRRSYEPTSTYPELLLPLLRLGKVEEALGYHRQGWPLVARKPTQHYLTEYADHLTFLALTDNWARGLQIVGRVLPAALATVSLSLRFDFILSALLFFERLAESGQDAVKLRLPAGFPLHQDQGEYRPADLLPWLRQQADDLAGRFDARNGNAFFRDRLAELAELKRLARPCPLEAGEAED
jgi:hypothetical protein